MTSTLLLLGAALAAGPAEPQSWAVDPATTAVLVEDHRVPLVELHLSFPAGNFSPWLRESGAGQAFELMMYDAAGKLRPAADALAVSFSMSVDDWSSDLVVTCLKEDLPAVRALVQQALTADDLDPAELKRAEQGRKVAWAASQKDFDFVLEQAGRRLLFAEGDPRRLKTEEPAPYGQDVPALIAARDQLVALPGRVIGLAGDLSREEAEAFARDLLPAAGAAPATLAPDWRPLATDRPAEHTVRLPRLTQTYLAYGREDLSWSDPAWSASLLANHVLGGHFYSRLYVALRHEGGETYGARVTRDAGQQPGPLALTTFTRSENAAATEEKLRKVLETFHAAGLSETELAEAKTALAGARLLQQESPGQILGTWIWERARGLPEGFREEAVRRAGELGLEEVNAFVRAFYDPAKFTMITLEAE